jgi:hypothetical protein
MLKRSWPFFCFCLFSFNFFPPQGLARTLAFLGWYKQYLIQFPDRCLRSPDGEYLILANISLELMPLDAPPQDASESAPSKGRVVEAKEAEVELRLNSLAENRIGDGETKTKDGNEQRGDELASNYAESASPRTRSSSSSESSEGDANGSSKIVRSGAPAEPRSLSRPSKTTPSVGGSKDLDSKVEATPVRTPCPCVGAWVGVRVRASLLLYLRSSCHTNLFGLSYLSAF